MYSLYIKFQEKIFTGKRIIQLWNFGNFGIPEIIPKILVTLRFSKISLHELKGNCKCFKMRYWPHFYVDPTHSNTYFSKVGIWRVLLQGTVHIVGQFLCKNPKIDTNYWWDIYCVQILGTDFQRTVWSRRKLSKSASSKGL